MRVGGGQLPFGLLHVRAAQEQFGRQAHRNLRRSGGDGRHGGHFRQQRAGRLAQQNSQPVDGSLERTFQRGDLGPGGGEQRGGLLHIEVARQAMLETVLGDGQALFLRRDVFTGNRQSLLIAARVNIIARDFPDQRYQHVAPAEFRGGHFGLGRLLGAADAAENVQLPGSVEAGLIDIVFKRDVRRQGKLADDRLVLALPVAAS